MTLPLAVMLTHLLFASSVAGQSMREANVARVAVGTPLVAARLASGSEQDPAGTGRMVLYGLGGGALGLLAGGLAGALVADEWSDCPFEDWVCELHGAAVGAIVVESALVPLGVHLANDRRGSYLPALGASLALGAAGAWIAYELDVPVGPIVLGLTPIAQLLASIRIERGSAR